jgi:AFG3 family protein
MAENTSNPVPEKKNDKNIKPRFNTNWIFFIVIASIILFEIIYGRNSSQNATPRQLKDMIANRDIERLVVVNKEQAEIYLKKEAIESGRYPGVEIKGKGIGLQVPKPQYTYNIGDISNFEPFIEEEQKKAGIEEKDWIYTENSSALLAYFSCTPYCCLAVLYAKDGGGGRWRSRRYF